MVSSALLLGVYNSNIGMDTVNKCSLLGLICLVNSTSPDIKFNGVTMKYPYRLIASTIANVGLYYLGSMVRPKK